jgi:hypothetical protein
MLTGLSLRTFGLLAATSLLLGCSTPGPIRSRYTTIGTLKTSLSHLEFENQQLRSKVTSLESDNRDIENRLVQEENLNGDLSARLDDARDVMAQHGYDWGNSNSSGGTTRDDSSSRTLPAGRSNRTPRKPPFARIPGRVDSPPPADGYDDEFNRPSLPSNDAFGPQSLRDDGQWLPIARGATAPGTKVR